jgi:uncharacterized protein
MPIHVPPTGAPCWFELSSINVAQSRAFYSALFDWQCVDQDMGEFGVYTFVRNATGVVGAMWQMPKVQQDLGAPSNWGVYFKVAHCDQATQTAIKLGATLIAGPMDVGASGRMSVLTDPSGAFFNLWQANQVLSDFAMFETHAVGWVELASRDAAAAKGFYQSLLAWQYQDNHLPEAAGGGVYSEYAVDGTRYGGIMQMNQQWGDLPSHWSIYILVDSVDACVEKTLALGGKIAVPAFDAPGVGRIAMITDPAGANNYVIQLFH